ncbi:MAG: hypothetical protein EPO57_06835 [Chitinophagaceae bacterium]|nr:MAG: hypothetical protein EPO57_06835 [Chitinophagaceae bacterium]
MPELEKKIIRIQEKLQQLMKQHLFLQKENLQLKKELTAVNSKGLINQQSMETLKQQVEVLKITSGNWDEVDKLKFEKRINSYLKEIDRCITYLSN